MMTVLPVPVHVNKGCRLNWILTTPLHTTCTQLLEEQIRGPFLSFDQTLINFFNSFNLM